MTTIKRRFMDENIEIQYERSKKMNSGYTLSYYLSAYEGDAPISIIKNNKYVCHGIPYSIIRDQDWYDEYADEYVISFKIVKDEKANGETVLLLLM